MPDRIEQQPGQGDDTNAWQPEFTPGEIELLFSQPAGCIDDLGFTAAYTRAQQAGFPNVTATGPEGDEARARVAAIGEQMVTEARAGQAGIPAAYAAFLEQMLRDF
jgi:hypothetical protein